MHPFHLCYTIEDDSGEYYRDSCEERKKKTQSIGFIIVQIAVILLILNIFLENI